MKRVISTIKNRASAVLRINLNNFSQNYNSAKALSYHFSISSCKLSWSDTYKWLGSFLLIFTKIYIHMYIILIVNFKFYQVQYCTIYIHFLFYHNNVLWKFVYVQAVSTFCAPLKCDSWFPKIIVKFISINTLLLKGNFEIKINVCKKE